jgi:cytidine deaminase
MTTDERERMLEAAVEARANAYAPYSGFAVGAAVLGRHGGIYAGCNVENASYPVSLCAERGAIAAAVAAGETGIDAVLILSDATRPCPPCGMCRQALAEFGPDMAVVMVGAQGALDEAALRDLLPAAFGPGFLDDERDGSGR